MHRTVTSPVGATYVPALMGRGGGVEGGGRVSSLLALPPARPGHSAPWKLVAQPAVRRTVMCEAS